MKLPASKEQVCQIVLVISSLALVGAWIAEYVFGFQACALCLYQRYFYIAAISILSISLFFFGGRYKNFFLILTSLILLSCAATAAYQVAVENKWVELPKVCEAPEIEGSFEDFKAKVLATPHVACDKVEWSFLGISMAGYNFFLALFLSFISFIGVFVDDKNKKKFARR